MDNLFKLESISKLTKLMKQPPPKHPLIDIIDFSKLDFKKLGKKYSGQKAVTELYTILLKRMQAGSVKYGRSHLDFQEGSLFFIAPNQVMTFENPEIDKSDYNWGVYFHPDLIKGTSLFSKMQQYTFFHYSADEVLHLSENEKQSLTEVVYSIKKEINRPIDKHTKLVLASGIELLLNHCMRYYDRQFITRSESNKELIATLTNYLRQYFESESPQQSGLPTVQQCAEIVHLSPNYLTDLLKKETGKSTLEYIHYHVLEIAKNQLLSSNATVSQIAYGLGFEYPQYFSTMFKKKVGMSPLEYRNLN